MLQQDSILLSDYKRICIRADIAFGTDLEQNVSHPALKIFKLNGETALMTAVNHDMSAQIKVRLQRGADPNISKADGTSALILVVKQLFDCVLSLLNSRLTDSNHRDNKGKNALDYVRQLKNQELINLL